MEITEVVEKRVKALTSIKVEELSRPNLGDVFHFVEQAKLLVELIGGLRELVELRKWIRVSDEEEKKFEILVRDTEQHVRAIESFVIQGNSDAQTQHRQIESTVSNFYQKRFLEQLLPLLERARTNKVIRGAENVQQSLSAVSKAVVETTEAARRIEALEAQSLEVLEKVGKRASIAGAAISSGEFGRQAKIHNTAAWYWLAIATGLAVLFILVLSGFLIDLVLNQNKFTEWEMIPVFILRSLILSVVYFALHQALRNYRANRHLYVLNQHRQLALDVYGSFMVSAKEYGHIVTEKAAGAIFSAGHTGYFSVKNNESSNFTNVVASDFLGPARKGRDEHAD